jgi:hypothetical protein
MKSYILENGFRKSAITRMYYIRTAAAVVPRVKKFNVSISYILKNTSTRTWMEPVREMESKMGIQIMAPNLLFQISVTREITL